jgi:hypothetical protein
MKKVFLLTLPFFFSQIVLGSDSDHDSDFEDFAMQLEQELLTYQTQQKNQYIEVIDLTTPTSPNQYQNFFSLNVTTVIDLTMPELGNISQSAPHNSVPLKFNQQLELKKNAFYKGKSFSVIFDFPNNENSQNIDVQLIGQVFNNKRPTHRYYYKSGKNSPYQKVEKIERYSLIKEGHNKNLNRYLINNIQEGEYEETNLDTTFERKNNQLEATFNVFQLANQRQKFEKLWIEGYYQSQLLFKTTAFEIVSSKQTLKTRKEREKNQESSEDDVNSTIQKFLRNN